MTRWSRGSRTGSLTAARQAAAGGERWRSRSPPRRRCWSPRVARRPGCRSAGRRLRQRRACHPAKCRPAWRDQATPDTAKRDPIEARPDEAPSSVALPPHDATPATAVAPAARRRARAEHVQPLDTEPGAAELFAAANAARRARDLRGAIDRYLALERRFPDTEEALVSLVSAGRSTRAAGRVGRRAARIRSISRPASGRAARVRGVVRPRARASGSSGGAATRSMPGAGCCARFPDRSTSPPAASAWTSSRGDDRRAGRRAVRPALAAGPRRRRSRSRRVPREIAAPSERAEITVVAAAPCAPPLRDVIADQLADVTSEVVWTCRDRLDPEDQFRQTLPGGSALRVWIDLRMGAEARLTLERVGPVRGPADRAHERPRRAGARTDRPDRQVCGAGRAR